ncbi:hypothetical protein [Terrisporobacter mayombei]|uniref:Uncharacterized protein n=1 Tax=Terrisporobacter mayombei TaxID=1541 RepID=A0ABY9Q1G2_9FIRM|nr:hypothetical protein [Terrisporobacter mayombei]MCC3867477.1 hypothetical protein [Terrisporobacter mayombei]WMT81737.1 hypothetical protein TEMA_20850 [Terrisporobacter mayombei]
MNSNKKYICIGLIFSGISFLIGQLHIFYIILPDFIKGFLEGFSISLGLILILFGLYCESYDLKKIRNYKSKIFNKVLGK